MDLVIQVRDAEAPFLMELLAKFDFVRVKQADESASIAGFERSVQQMKAMRTGQLPKPSIEDLFTTNE